MPGVLGVLAATLSISLIWPQVWLCCRRRRTSGLSPTATFLGVALNLSWLAFGALTGCDKESVHVAFRPPVGTSYRYEIKVQTATTTVLGD